jgi:hypothetical protein
MCISEDGFDKFVEELVSSDEFVARILFKRPAKLYLPHLDIPDDDVSHVRIQLLHKYEVSLDGHISSFDRFVRAFLPSLPRLYIDAMVHANDRIEHPPFGVPDFRCNALVMTSHGIGLRNRLGIPMNDYALVENEKNAILCDILQDVARVITPKNHAIPGIARRIKKMEAGGWKIEYKKRFFIADGAEGDICSICLSPSNDADGELIRNSCCNTRYHAKCFCQAARTGSNPMMKTESCTVCKKSIAVNGLLCESVVLEGLLTSKSCNLDDQSHFDKCRQLFVERAFAEENKTL